MFGGPGRAIEPGILSYDAHGVIHPEIYEAGFKSMRLALMTSRFCASGCATGARKRTHRHTQSGVMRGGKGPREAKALLAQASPPQSNQVFGGALKWVNREIQRMEKLEARNAHIEAARRAFPCAMRLSFSPCPRAGDTPDARACIRCRRRTRVAPAKIGNVLQATSQVMLKARDVRNRSMQ